MKKIMLVLILLSLNACTIIKYEDREPYYEYYNMHNRFHYQLKISDKKWEYINHEAHSNGYEPFIPKGHDIIVYETNKCPAKCPRK